MSNTNQNPVSTKVITGPDVRFSYVHVFNPVAIKGSTPKYSVSLIIPKSDTETVRKIKAAIKAAFDEGIAKLQGNSKTVPTFAATSHPLKDGDIMRPDDPAYKNSYFLSANSIDQPGVVDKDLQPIIDPAEFYSGCYGRASLNFYAFNANLNKGIACGLNNIQKLRDGERLGGGRPSAASDFGGLDVPSDNAEDDFLL